MTPIAHQANCSLKRNECFLGFKYEKKYSTFVSLVSIGKEVAQYSSNVFKIIIQIQKEGQRFTREAGDVYEHQRPAKATVDEYMLFDLGKQRAEYKSGLEHLQGKAMYASIIGQPKPTLDEYTNDVRAHSP